jgi:hypothetical protein
VITGKQKAKCDTPFATFEEAEVGKYPSCFHLRKKGPDGAEKVHPSLICFYFTLLTIICPSQQVSNAPLQSPVQSTQARAQSLSWQFLLSMRGKPEMHVL